MLKAMDELDEPEKMPFGLNPSVWQRFCLVRRSKVESEQKVIQRLERNRNTGRETSD